MEEGDRCEGQNFQQLKKVSAWKKKSRPWESLDRIYEEELVIGRSNNMGYDGEVLAISKYRLEN